MILVQAAAILTVAVLTVAMLLEWFDHRRYNERRKWS